MTTFHPIAWLAWSAGALVAVQSMRNPVLLLVAIAALLFTATSLASERGPVALMLKVGAFALVVRVVLFGLTGHPGGTTLFTLPEWRLPALLGGFHVGGAVSAEVLAHSATEGLRLAALLLCFGVLTAVVEPARIVRLVPRVLFEAGLVVAIGATFVPSLARTARDVRDTQRLRGSRARGVRAAARLAMPVLSTTLERAEAIAESMEARGWGRTSGSRTRYRRERVRAHDIALIVAGAATALAALATRAEWSAYPTIGLPRTPVGATLAACALALPVLVASARRRLLLAVDGAHETTPHAGVAASAPHAATLEPEPVEARA